MDDLKDSFRGETGALADRAKPTLAEELKITRWWLQRMTQMMAAPTPKAPEVLLGALNEFRDHLRRCYQLEEEQGLRGEDDTETPTITREERRLFEAHRSLTGRMEVLLNDLRKQPAQDLDATLEALGEFLQDCQQLDLEETHFVQRVAYAEYGVGD